MTLRACVRQAGDDARPIETASSRMMLDGHAASWPEIIDGEHHGSHGHSGQGRVDLEGD